MANPTTNYSFAMPTNTDLVKDLPADFEIFGQAVDTQMKTNADAAIAKTIVDAKGDIIAATAADTVSRLAVGANDTVLTADSSTATGLKWAAPAAGGMTLISTTTLSGTSVTLSSIPQTYNILYLVITGVTNSTGNDQLSIRPNDVSNLVNYAAISDTTSSVATDSNKAIELTIGETMLSTNANNAFVCTINNYTSSTRYKPINSNGFFVTGASGNKTATVFGTFRSNTEITSLKILVGGGGVTFNGGTVLLYGVK